MSSKADITSPSIISSELAGATLVSAASSLHSFGLNFADGRGLLLTAAVEEGDSVMNIADELTIDSEIRPVSDMPKLAEAVCSVDWSWIYGANLLAVNALSGPRGKTIVLKFDTVGPITVSVGAWEGKPFLSFMPYKKP
ncbi:MAG: hypothetical protein QG574_5426 [Cyanobacteriota bacterium erpe_2018_sw_21hr_WHONDRS-SW48-000092_B_bin.40]|jgi:hypothetical protein|nr:hypothetical protein [Cyanobacteriota bacterium erpe_2018_sw_21hr_WHONDRS-SW48-000092_B_bin.40]